MLNRLKDLFGQQEEEPSEPVTAPSVAIVRPTGMEIASPEWIDTIRQTPCLYGPSRPEDLSEVREADWFSQRAASTVTVADTFLRHEFNMLGSGPFVPHDPDRPVEESGYHPIDWYLDPSRNLRFPTGIPHKEWNLYEMRPGNADIKFPWELARCQHWNTLSQAYLITGDPGYAAEIANQLDDFMQANPIGIGVNYTCTMDVGIRALNWALALEAIRQCPDLSLEWWERAYRALYDHCDFIFDNLENKYEVTSNHFLSNVVGLHYACQPFRGHDKGDQWHEFCRNALETEIDVQVLEDGADYESSIPYHRLVTELFLGSGWLAKHRGEPLSANYYTRLEGMMTYLIGVLRPDGLMPQVGDADDGRLHIFSRCGGWQPQSAIHILAPAGYVLDREDWIDHAGEEGNWESFWWGASKDSRTRTPLPPVQRLFAQAGHAAWRKDGDYLLFCNSIVGTKGFGNHKHNDQLSFEFHHDGCPLIVDPGSYVYTSDFDARNMFRGTGYHNTASVDGVEQNDLRPEWIFRMFESGTPEHLCFDEDKEAVRYSGLHVGYQRLEEPITHRRDFKYLKDRGVLLIRDQFSGTGTHNLRWHFHCAPDVRPFSSNGSMVWLGYGEDRLYALVSLSTIPAVVRAAWYSPSYGVRVPCSAVEFSQTTKVDDTMETVFAVAPALVLEQDSLQELAMRFQQELSRQ